MWLLYHHRTRATGAEGRHIRGIVGAFKRRGWRVTVVSPPGVELDRTADIVPKTTPSRLWSIIAEWSPQLLFELLELGYNLLSLRTLRQETTEGLPDLIYERYALFTWIPTWFARRRNIPIILEINDATLIQRSRRLCARRIATRIENWIFKNATHLVTVSGKFRELLSKQHGIPADRIHILPNAVDPSVWIADHPSSKSTSAFTLGMVAVFLPWHGVEFVLKAVAGFLKETGSRLLLVGDGPDRARIVRWIDDLSLREHVRLTGFVPATKVPALIHQMDVCVIGDLAEHASPMKLFEFMVCGKPVLAPSYPSIREIITHNVDGWLFEPLQSSALIAGLQCIYTNPQLKERLGRSAQQTVLQKHTWDFRAREIEGWVLTAKNGE